MSRSDERRDEKSLTERVSSFKGGRIRILVALLKLSLGLDVHLDSDPDYRADILRLSCSISVV